MIGKKDYGELELIINYVTVTCPWCSEKIATPQFEGKYPGGERDLAGFCEKCDRPFMFALALKVYRLEGVTE